MLFHGCVGPQRLCASLFHGSEDVIGRLTVRRFHTPVREDGSDDLRSRLHVELDEYRVAVLLVLAEREQQRREIEEMLAESAAMDLTGDDWAEWVADEWLAKSRLMRLNAEAKESRQ